VVYDVPANVILDSAARAVSGWDIVTSMIKAWVFGVIISVVCHDAPPGLCQSVTSELATLSYIRATVQQLCRSVRLSSKS
jgi:hypothetical protein